MQTDTFFKPNELIAVIDQLQVNRLAKHLCNYFLKYAQEQIKFHDHKGNSFEVPVNEMNCLAEIGKKDYKFIENALETLMTPVTLRAEDDLKHYVKLVPIYYIHINTDLGLYQFRLCEEIIELLRVTDYFTKLKLTEFNNLKSRYSLVIFEWLRRYETSPQIPIISVNDLRKITGTQTVKSYNDFSLLKARVIDVATKEINETTPYQLSYETIKERAKTRHKVTAIQFYFTKKEIKAEAENKPENADPPPPTYEKLRRVCGKFMTLEFYFKATYIYFTETLDQYADDLAEKNYKANRNVFFSWLDERCQINQKGYCKRKYVFSEEFFRSVFSTEEIDPSSVVTTEDGREMWLGRKIQHVHEEYVSEAMQYFGKLPYNEYRKYLSDIWKRFEQQSSIHADNVFEE